MFLYSDHQVHRDFFIIIIIIFINCNWVFTRWQWLIYMYTIAAQFREVHMRSMQWQFGILGTISAFAFRHRETKKTLCRCVYAACGHAVTQLVEALRYKPEARGIDSRLRHLKFSLT
jgi:hypothetical protein